MDIKNTLELVALGASLGQAFHSANQDGTINVADIGHLMLAVPHLGPALDDISKVPAELSDLDSKEISLITDRVVEIVGDISNAKAERIASSSLALGLEAYNLITAIRSDDAT